MQGIINSGMSAEDAARPQQMQTQGGAMAQRQNTGVDMDPSVAQQQRNVLVNAMLGRLYGEQLDSAAKILDQSADNPVEGIGRVVSGLLGAAYKSVTDDGRTIPPGVMFQAGMMASPERYRQLKAQTEEAGMQVREDGGRVIAERTEQRRAGDMDRQGGIISRGGA